MSEEHSLPTAPPASAVRHQKFLFQLDGLLHRALDRVYNKIEVFWAQTRRHPEMQHDTDVSERLRKLEDWRTRLDSEPREINYGVKIYGPSPPVSPDNKPKTINPLLRTAAIMVVIALIGILYGKLRDAEHRLSALEASRESSRPLDNSTGASDGTGNEQSGQRPTDQDGR